MTTERAAPPAGLDHILGHSLQALMEFMHESGLSRPQIHALLYIFHAGECQVAELAALSDSSPAAASQLVERLVQQGLVVRREDPRNRRIKRLRLTERSSKLLHHALAPSPHLMELMAVLSPTQRRTVHQAFRYLAEASLKIHQSKSRKEAQHAFDTE